MAEFHSAALAEHSRPRTKIDPLNAHVERQNWPDLDSLLVDSLIVVGHE